MSIVYLTGIFKNKKIERGNISKGTTENFLNERHDLQNYRRPKIKRKY